MKKSLLTLAALVSSSAIADTYTADFFHCDVGVYSAALDVITDTSKQFRNAKATLRLTVKSGASYGSASCFDLIEGRAGKHFTSDGYEEIRAVFKCNSYTVSIGFGAQNRLSISHERDLLQSISLLPINMLRQHADTYKTCTSLHSYL